MNAEPELCQETHRFSLVYSGVNALPENFEDALFEAGCDDASLLLRDGLLHVEFDRECPSFREALTSAIEDVERSGHQIRLVRVEPY